MINSFIVAVVATMLMGNVTSHPVAHTQDRTPYKAIVYGDKLIILGQEQSPYIEDCDLFYIGVNVYVFYGPILMGIVPDKTWTFIPVWDTKISDTIARPPEWCRANEWDRTVLFSKIKVEP